TKKHGEVVLKGGVSSAADAIAFGGHVGTHMDALCHFSCDGKLYGGVDIGANQDYAGGVKDHSIDMVQPIIRRGVLLDIARDSGPLSKDFGIAPDRLEAVMRDEGVTIQPGDVVLVRTGWAQFWNDPVQFINGGEGSQPTGPGIELAAAQWLSAGGIFAA